mgnify:CR=1 FL=1
MDILHKLRILFWGLVIGLWGLFMYQYMSEDMSSLKRFKIGKNPFPATAGPRPTLNKYPIPAPFLPQQPQGPGPQQPAQPGQPQSSLDLVKTGDIKDVVSTPLIPGHSAGEKMAITGDAAEGNYPEAPAGFAMKVTRHFVVYEEGAEVSEQLYETLESLHGSIMLDLVAFSPWTREKKVYIYYSQSGETYRRLTGRPAWSGGAASLNERKIYV